MSEDVKKADEETSAVSKFDLENAGTVIDLRVEPAEVKTGDELAEDDVSVVEEEVAEDSDSTDLTEAPQQESEDKEDDKQPVEPDPLVEASETNTQDQTTHNSEPAHSPPPSEPPREEFIEVITTPASDIDKGFPWLHVGVSIVSTALVCLGLFTLYSDSLLGRIEIDSFIGANLEEVELILSDSAVVIETQEGRQDGTEVGEVIDQRPRGGSTLDPGEVLLLVVSQGSELISVPEVAGLTLEEAQDVLAGRGFEVGEVVEERDSATIDQGSIIEIVVSGQAVDGEVPTGTAVDFVVSNGLVTIPRVTADEIESVLVNQLGLNVRIEERFDRDAEPGQVLQTNPGTGTKVATGSDVTVVIASDQRPQQIDIPNVLGRNVFEAVGVLRSAGFNPVLDTSPPNNSNNCNGRLAFASEECRRFNSQQVWRMNPRNDDFPGADIRIFVSPDAANSFNNSQNN